MRGQPQTRRPVPPRAQPGLRPAPAGLCLLALLLLAAAPASGGAGEENAERLARGEISYRVFCSNCHGESGRGDGPVADVLTVAPTDLTRIPADEAGHFPAERLAAIIDGRLEVAGHGHREMPIWGLSFQERGRESDQEAEVEARIGQLVAYLQSIQEEPRTDPDNEEPQP